MTHSVLLEVSVRIAAPPAEVFPYFTDASLMVQWLGEKAELDAVPGGVFAVDVGGAQARGRFVEIDAPRRVVFTWGTPGNDTLPPGSTTVEIVLTAEGDETIVNLTHHNLPPDQLPSHRSGWTMFLGQLQMLPPFSSREH